jgi:hypothetical protein
VKKLFAVVIFTVGFVSTAAAWDVDWKKGKLAHLAPYIGTGHYEAVLNDPIVKVALQRQVGSDLPELMRNMGAQGSIDFVGGYLVLSGARPHETNKHRAIVVVQILDANLVAGIFRNEKYILYSRKSDEYVEVPEVVWEWIYSDQIEKLIEYAPGENFEWIKR